MIFLFIALVPFILGICFLLSAIFINKSDKYFEENKMRTKAKIVGYAHQDHDSHHSRHPLVVSLIDIDDKHFYSCDGLANNSKHHWAFGTIVDVYIAPKRFGKMKYYDVRLAKENMTYGHFSNWLIRISIGLFALSALFVIVGLIKII